MPDTSIYKQLETQMAAWDKPEGDALYYVLTLLADGEKVVYETQTGFKGWADVKRQYELRGPRLVYGRFSMAWEHLGQPYCCVHTSDQLDIFLLCGGNALISQTIMEDHLAEFLKVYPTAKVGMTGFVDLENLPKRALSRRPENKLRMSIINRDHRRCKICGRKPDDYLDLELHVHHIRPWSKGGITDPRNLITLCNTCHSGLHPHFDASLYSYIEPPTPELAKDFINFCKASLTIDT